MDTSQVRFPAPRRELLHAQPEFTLSVTAHFLGLTVAPQFFLLALGHPTSAPLQQGFKKKIPKSDHTPQGWGCSLVLFISESQVPRKVPGIQKVLNRYTSGWVLLFLGRCHIVLGEKSNLAVQAYKTQHNPAIPTLPPPASPVFSLILIGVQLIPISEPLL